MGQKGDTVYTKYTSNIARILTLEQLIDLRTASTLSCYFRLYLIVQKCPGIENNGTYINDLILRICGKYSFLWHADVRFI